MTTAASAPAATSMTTAAERYREHGYVVLRGLLPRALTDPARARVEAMVDGIAQDMLAAGEIADPRADLPLERRLAALAPRGTPRAGALTRGIASHPEPFALARHPALLDALEALIGPELTFHGDYHLRPKFPDEQASAFPWHQDSQYYGAPTRVMRVVTAWVPLADTDVDNGCLWIIPGSHRWGLLAGARQADNHVVTAEDVERRGDAVPLPMRVGDVVLFSNLTFHASRVNRSERMRWSLDCRFHPTRGSAPLGEEESAGYEMLFASWRAQGVVPVPVRTRSGRELPSFAAWQAQRAAAAR